MKAPINFAQKINGHIIKTGPFPGDYVYKLSADDFIGNQVWIYPQSPNSRNVILMEFNWEKQFYTIKIARSGDGNNFHTTLPAFDFVRTSQFLSFAAFHSWMVAKLEDFHKHFGY